MKNAFKKILSFIIAVCVVPVAFACKKPTKTYSEAVLYGFESYNEIVSITPKNYMGSAELSDDEKYVTQGEKCLKWYIESPFHGLNTSVSQGTYATPHFKIFAGNFFKDISDFNDVKSYSLDFSNANDFTIYALMWIESGGSVIATAHSELAAGESATVETLINKLSTETLSSVSAVCFGVYTEHFDKPVTVYIDNLRITKGQADPKDIAVPKTGNVVGFDDIGYFDYAYPINTLAMPMVALDYNLNPEYTSGKNGSLKADILPCTDGSHMLTADYMHEKQHNGFGIAKSLLDKIDFEVLEFMSGGKLKLDIYACVDAPMYVYIKIVDNAGAVSTTRVKLEPNAWNTVAVEDFGSVDLKNVVSLEVLFDMYSVYKPMSFYFNNLFLGV